MRRIEGACDARFAPVREAFAENFASRDEVGAAVSVRVAGREVVDLWGGQADAECGLAWQRDTLVNAYSVGKGMLATLVLTLIDRGRLDLDARVSAYWPEFAADGKGDVTLRVLLSHRAGLPAVRERLPEGAMLDWARMCEALGRQAPYWEPGTRHGYHCNTYGFLVGEVVRRVTGRRVGAALRGLVTGPLEADYRWGLPRSEHARAARVLGAAGSAAPRTEEQWAVAFPPTGDRERDLMIWHTYFNPSGLSGGGVINTAGWRLAEIPSTNGHGTARGVSAVYAALLESAPSRLVGPDLLAEATSILADGEDAVLGRPTRFGLGFQLPSPSRRIGGSPAAFGHYGHGGSLGFADPDADVAFGYVMNSPGPRWQTPRVQALMDALYACLAG